MRTLGLTLIYSLALSFGVAPALAGEPVPDPRRVDEGTWLTLRGTVESIDTQRLVLDYDGGAMTVEFDPGHRRPSLFRVFPGEAVSVTGQIDEGMFDRATLRPASVYSAKLDTFVYFDPAHDERAQAEILLEDPGSNTIVQGRVVERHDEGFDIDTGSRRVRIVSRDADRDVVIRPRGAAIQVGDRVTVAGDVDEDFFDGRELIAQTIHRLEEKPIED